MVDSKKVKNEQINPPNFDNRYNSVEPLQTFSPSFRKQNVDIISEQEIYEPVKNSISVKNKRSLKLPSNKASIISANNLDYSEEAPQPDLYLKASRKSSQSPRRNGDYSVKSSIKMQRSSSPRKSNTNFMESSIKSTTFKKKKKQSRQNSAVSSTKKRGTKVSSRVKQFNSNSTMSKP